MIINNKEEEHKKDVKKLEATLKENREVSNKACQELEKIKSTY